MPPKSNQPVCVTGASGFIGSAMVRELLEQGYRVRGTVRSPAKIVDEGHLTALPGAAERLTLMAADLNQPGSFDEAIAGCQYVVHCASPYVISVVDPQRDLVDPAVNGTRSVLEACRKAATVKRVVITSSFAAMTDEPTGRYDEQIWNQTSRLDRNPYYYSKTLAERTAWDFVSNTAGFELISINPALVIGPSIVPSLNESNQVLADLTNGRFPGILSLRWGLIDIRDVAIAHRLAIETDAASGRYLCTAGVWSMRQVVEVARASDLGLGRLASIPLDNVFGDILVKLGATLQSPGARSYLRSHIGRRYEIDTTRIRTELGIEFRSVETSIIEAYWDLRRWGHVTV